MKKDNKKKNKRIIINGRFLTQNVTGVQRYAIELTKKLDEIEGREIYIAIPKNLKNVPVFKNIKMLKFGLFNDNLWEQISYPLYAIFHNMLPLNFCNSSPIIYPGIVCIHDVKIKAHPEFFNKKFLLWYNILFLNATKRAKCIITVSQYSKNEIIKYYNVLENNIYIVYNAWNHFEKVKIDERTLEKYNLKQNEYFFSLSSLEPNKNLKWIINVAKMNADKVFVIAGSINNKIFSQKLGYQCPNNVRFIGYVTDEEAKALMRDCRCFIFPSIYEGFGLPPLEALSVGSEVIISNTSSLPEIYGNSAHYIDPYDYGDIDIDCILSNKVKNAEYILNKYLWTFSSKKLVDIIKKFN